MTPSTIPPLPLTAAAESRDLDALLAAVSDAIQSLVAWDVAAFQSAVERQREICSRLRSQPGWRKLPESQATARQVRELTRVYDRLLQHSVHWTRTIQSILQAGHPFPRRASVHFRG